MKYLMKVVNALIAAAIFPVAIFLNFIFVQIGTTESAMSIFQMFGAEATGVGIEESLSLYNFYQIYKGDHYLSDLLKNSSGPFMWPQALEPLNGRLIAFAVFFVICILIALFILIWSICSDKRLPVIIAAAGGILSAAIMTACFNSAANMLTSGTIPLFSLFEQGLITDLLSGLVGVDTLMLGGFHSGFFIIFIGIILWTGAFMLVDLGEEK
ncbi:MAG: hypothetical protein J6R20_04435 [Clostridia bacterium]|nr:hypothetical protein [Clostridia bacterium]